MKADISLLSNVTLDLAAQMLSDRYQVYIPSGFDTWQMELLDEQSIFYKNNFHMVFVILHISNENKRFHSLSEGMELIDQWIEIIRHSLSMKLSTPFFIADLDVIENNIVPLSCLPIEKSIEAYWINKIIDLMNHYQNVYRMDIKRLIEDIGRQKFYSSKMWYMGSMPYSLQGLNGIIQEIDDYNLAVQNKRKKLLILDLDNTLWGGVIGEDGVDKIKLSKDKEGACFLDFQILIKELKDLGVLLAIVSKNNQEDVNEVFINHINMVLKWDDFAAIRINWLSKAQNILDIVSELNIGIDSVVFIDDNPMERELIRQELPEVIVPEFPKDITQLKSFIQTIYREYFLILNLTKEDKEKTNIYQQDKKRQELKSRLTTPTDYIKALEIDVIIHPMMDSELERSAQLCNKTNQFNVTTKRYTKQELMRLSQNPSNHILTIISNDKYGENGLIGLLILKENDKPLDSREVFIDTFILSCRVMGRYIEELVYEYIYTHYLKENFQSIRSQYIPTKKNLPVESLYDKLGFQCIYETVEEKIYTANLTIKDSTGIENLFHTVEFTMERSYNNG